MNSVTLRALGLVGLLVAAAASAQDTKFKLEDTQLERVTAGTQSDARELARFDFSRTTDSGRRARGEGSVSVVTSSAEYTLFLGDGAQGNLSSLININAINSQITVLLNLNISIDSTIGTVNQLNVQTPIPPGALPGPK